MKTTASKLTAMLRRTAAALALTATAAAALVLPTSCKEDKKTDQEKKYVEGVIVPANNVSDCSMSEANITVTFETADAYTLEADKTDMITIAAGQEKGDAAGDTLRLMSYNIRNGRGMGNAVDYDRVAAAINRLAADVVAVQEVDSATGRSGGRDLLRELAERTLTHRVYAPAIDFDGGKYGIGILSKEKPLAWRQVPLPGREEARTLLVVEFEKYVYCCVHLSLTEEDRMASLPIIRREAAKAGKPFFIAGDMNAHPDEAFIRALQARFRLLTRPDRPTYPADKPHETLDYIAVYAPGPGSHALVGSQVWDEPAASDHRPVTADVVLAPQR